MGIPAQSISSTSLLDRLDGDSVLAASFPTALKDSRPASIRLPELFEAAETRGIGGKRLLYFVALSQSLFETEGVPTPWIMIISDFLRNEGLEDLYAKFRLDFIKRKKLTYSEPGFTFDFSRDELIEEFKASLENSGKTRWGDALASQRDADVEELFSRLFAAGQRSIISRCLNGESLTKTERETFSRTIKKRLLAMLDPEVQRVARVLTGPGFRKKRDDETDAAGPRLVRHPAD